jgi:hypothetical protein
LGETSETGWVQRRQEEWKASEETWEDYFHGWAHQHGLHSARRILRDLDRRFERLSCSRGPYYFSELLDTTEEDELTAINAGRIKAGRVTYVGRATDE